MIGQEKEQRVFPEMETERLILREFVLDDLGFLFRHFSDPEVCRYLYDAEPFVSYDQARFLIAAFARPDEKDQNRWGLLEKATGELVGTCGFMFWDKTNDIAEIGFDLTPACWGRGYMAEALAAALGVAFGNMKLNRVQVFIATENERAVRLLERLGFANEGTVREKHRFRGRYYDHYCFALLARDRRVLAA